MLTPRAKKNLLRHLPRGVGGALLRLHYLGRVRAFDEARWPWSATVRRLVARGDTAVDVGANIGCITRLLSAWVGPEGVVHAVEPVPQTFALLSHNVGRLRLANVRLHECAASDRGGEGRMEVPRDLEGFDNIYESRVVQGDTATAGARAVEVRLAPLDALLAGDCGRLSFIKIDVEGHEFQAIQGAAGAIGRSAPALLIEVNGDPEDASCDAGRLVQQLSRLGYGVFCLEGGTLRPRRPGDRHYDYLFLKDAHRRLLG
jgi:FkbM family methyltransferase